MLEHETVELFNLITQNTNLIEFTNKVQQHIFNNPVMITNSYFKVIGMSSDIEFKDAVWDYAKKNHCCSKESIISFRNDKASKLLFSQNQSFLYKTNLGKNIPRILGRIAQNNTVYGYLIVFEVTHKLEKIDIQKANLVCKALSTIMQNLDDMESVTNSRREYFYRQLLESNIENKLEIENEILQFQWDFKSYFKVLSLIGIDAESHYIYLCNEINTRSEDVTSFVYKNQIILILNFNDETEEYKLINYIKDSCKSYSVKIGISRTFYDLSQLKIYFNQATRSRELGTIIKPDLYIYRYSEYEYHDMIMHYNPDEWSSLMCREYLSLKYYDKNNSTELVKTCIHYYICGLKSSKTAQDLCIHRNTLMYRLSVIEDIIKTNINDIKILDLIYHSHMIDELSLIYNQQIKKNPKSI